MCRFIVCVRTSKTGSLMYFFITSSPRGRNPRAGCLWGDGTWASWRVRWAWTRPDTSHPSWSPCWPWRRKPACHTNGFTISKHTDSFLLSFLWTAGESGAAARLKAPCKCLSFSLRAIGLQLGILTQNNRKKCLPFMLFFAYLMSVLILYDVISPSSDTWLPPMPWQLKMPTFSFSLRAMLSRHWLVSTLRIWSEDTQKPHWANHDEYIKQTL